MTPSASNWQTKNLDGALRAIERARDLSSVPFQTVITGSTSGLDQTGLRSSLRETIVTGRVPFEDLPKLYRNATVFVSLSKYEGFGNPLGEAMSCGTASISSRGGSLPEIAGDGALVYDGDDNEAIADGIVALLASPEKRNALIEKAIPHIKTFSIDAHVDNMLNLYKVVAEQKHK